MSETTERPAPPRVIKAVSDVVHESLSQEEMSRVHAMRLLRAIGYETADALELIWLATEGATP